MKKTVIALALMLVVTGGCKKEKKFVEPDFILRKWAKATETLNYKDYAKCEAYPKAAGVFKDMYMEYYLADLMVTKIEDLDKEDVKKDKDGNSYIHRMVYFECSEVKRKTKKPVNVVRGDVVFIRFIGTEREQEGWLMSNRTLMRIKR
ncbi:MAG: hypothetical protein GY754_07045 [bacterium]|nr:hypothetical protein [bacterium]